MSYTTDMQSVYVLNTTNSAVNQYSLQPVHIWVFASYCFQVWTKVLGLVWQAPGSRSSPVPVLSSLGRLTAPRLRRPKRRSRCTPSSATLKTSKVRGQDHIVLYVLNIVMLLIDVKAPSSKWMAVNQFNRWSLMYNTEWNAIRSLAALPIFSKNLHLTETWKCEIESCCS